MDVVSPHSEYLTFFLLVRHWDSYYLKFPIKASIKNKTVYMKNNMTDCIYISNKKGLMLFPKNEDDKFGVDVGRMLA